MKAHKSIWMAAGQRFLHLLVLVSLLLVGVAPQADDYVICTSQSAERHQCSTYDLARKTAQFGKSRQAHRAKVSRTGICQKSNSSCYSLVDLDGDGYSLLTKQSLLPPHFTPAFLVTPRLEDDPLLVPVASFAPAKRGPPPPVAVRSSFALRAPPLS